MILDRYTTITIGTGNNALVISPTSENDVGIASGSLMLDQKIVDGDLEFGRLMSSEFSAQLFNTNQDFQGEQITADVTEDNVTTRIFTGVIESSKQDWSNTYRDIIAYDWIYYHREDNIASWWNSFWVSTRTQATVKQIRDSLLTYMGFSALSGTYINDNQVIKNEFQQFTNIKFETIFKMLCEIQLTIPHIKGDGSFELITFGTTATDISGMYEGSNSEWEDFTTQQITGIGIYDTSSNMVQLVGTNTNVLNIAGNLFLLNMSASQLTTIGNNMLTALTDFTFVPASVKMILSDFSLSLGKKVSTDVGNTYVMQNTYSGSLLVEQTIKGVAYSDVLNGNVPSINDDLITANKIAVVQHDIDGLSTEFGRLENNLENNYSTTTEMNSAIEQSAEGIRTEVSQTYVNQTTYNAEVQRLQDEIDGAIESYTGSAVPTLNNYPANEWTTTTERDKHLGDLYLVNASGGSYAGFYYRFDKSGSTYSWVHIPDNEVQKALADATEANQKAEAAQATADGIADDLSDNYSTTQQMNSAINQKADEIELAVSQTYATQQSVTTVKNSTIKSDVLHYLATSAGSGVTRSTSGWTTTVQSMTETKQYLWTYHTYTYGDNHTSDTDPIITGRYGQNGSQGPQGATGPQGPQGNKGDTGDRGISIVEVVPLYYASNSTTAPTAPTSNVTRTDTATRVWTRGIPALTSTDKYMYTCDQVKYSNNNYTWTSVVLDNSLTNLTERVTQAELDLQPDSITAKVESTNTFTTVQQHTELESRVNSRNYFLYFRSDKAVPCTQSFKPFPLSGEFELQDYRDTGSFTQFGNLSIPMKSLLGKQLRLSFDAISPNGSTPLQVYNRNGAPRYSIEQTTVTQQLSTSWEHFSIPLTVTDNGSSGTNENASNKIEFYAQSKMGAKIRNVKLEINEVETDWSYAPEDYANNTEAQGYANTAQTNAVNISKSYTDAQLQITSSSILSTVEQGYTTKTEFNNLQIGGENRFAMSELLPSSKWSYNGSSGAGTGTATINKSNDGSNRIYQLPEYGYWEWKPNASYVISIEAKGNGGILNIGANGLGGTYNKNYNLTNEWVRYSYIVTAPNTGITANGSTSFYNKSSSVDIQVRKPKIEYGNKPTDWSPAAEDMSSKSEVQQLSNMVAVKVNSSGRLVTAALGVDPASATSYFKVKADDIDIISNGNIQLTGKSIGITSTNFSVTSAGAITSTAGTIAGWSIDSEKLYKSGTVSGITYASYLKANELKISSGLSTLTEFGQTIIRSGSMQLIGQSGNPMKNIIIDGDGEESPGTGIGYIRTPRLVTSLIEPQVDNEVTIASKIKCNTNGNLTATTIYANSEFVCGSGIELGALTKESLSFIDFHWNTVMSGNDFTARICQRAESTVDLIGKNNSTWGIWRAASFNSQSSKYVKKNIKDVTEKEAKNILKLRPVKFDYKNSDLTNQRGLIAEEVLEVMPEMVSVPKDYTGFNKDEPWNTPSIDYSKFVPYLIKMIQIQQKDIDALKNK